MAFRDKISFARHFFFGIILGLMNLFSTIVNIYYLFKTSHNKYGIISIFLLWLPGLVTSIGFLVLYVRGNKTILRLKWWKLLVYPLALLFFYPFLPVILTIAYLATKNEKTLEKAIVSKYFTAFLDHGPHFVLRLVIVVLEGLKQGGEYDRHDSVFIFSMVTSFCSQIYTALWFNERKSTWLRWFFLAGPMYSATFACRAFTLAVLLRTTLDDRTLQFGAFILLLVVMYGTNLSLFRLCGQDWTRSAVFGIASILLPAGYNNDMQYYQVPKQDILLSSHHYELAEVTKVDAQAELMEQKEDTPEDVETECTDRTPKVLVPMRSAKFLLLYVGIHTVLMLVISPIIYFHQSDTGSKDALVIPQILGIVPGLFFAVGKSFLMPDMCAQATDDTTSCQKVCGGLLRGGKVCLATVFSILGFFSLFPAVFWTVIYKWFTSLDVTISLLDN